jgi:hypothetical protein
MVASSCVRRVARVSTSKIASEFGEAAIGVVEAVSES